MKSFKDYLKEDKEILDNKPKEVVDEAASMGDFLLGLGAAGGLLALKKGWDTWGKGSKLAKSLAFTTAGKAKVKKDAKEKRDKEIEDADEVLNDPDSSPRAKKNAEKLLKKNEPNLSKKEKEDLRQKRITTAKEKGDQTAVDKLSTDDEKAQAKVDASDKEKKSRETKADAAATEFEKDEQGRIKKQADAEKYKEIAKKAPDGWVTSPKDSPSAGKVWTTADQSKWEQDKAAKAAADKAAADQATKDKEAEAEKKRQEKEKEAEKVAAAKKKKRDQGRDATEKGIYGKGGTSKKSIRKAERKKAAAAELKKRAQQNQSFFPIPESLSGLDTEDRTQLLEELVLEETMTLQESEELQAIMALDDAKIKADINRKGQVVVKKKDLKKAEKILKKEFSGRMKTLMPKLVGEEVLEDGTDAMVNQYKNDTPGQRTAWEVVSKARAKIIEAVDAEAARELYLFMQNERSLMRQRDSIIKNISRKMKSGKYDHKQAPKLWMYWVDNGAKEYDNLYGSPGVKTFDKDTKMSVAIQLADEMKAEIELGNYS